MKRIRRLVDAMESALEKGLQTASLDYAPRPTSPKKPKKSTLPFRGAWQVKEAKALRNAILRWGLPLPPLFPAERARLLASDRTGFPAPALAEERELAAICDVVDSLVRDVQASFPSIPQPAQLLNPVTLSARDTAAPFPFHACPACVCRSAREGYCPFCDLYVGYRVLKVESSLLYKSYYDIQDLARFLESQTRSICDQPSRPRGKKSSEEEPPSDPPKIPAEVEAILPSLVLAQRLHSRLQLFYELQQLAWPRDRALLAALLQRWAAGASHPQETTSRGWRPEVHDLALLEGVYRWGVAEWDLLWRDPALPFFVDPLGERRKPHRRRRKGGKAKEGKGGKSKEEKEKYENDGKGGNIEEDGKGGKKDEEGNEEPVDETLEEETAVRSEKPPYTLEDAIRLKSPRVDRSQLVAGLSSLYVLKRINAMLRFLRQWNSLVVVTSFLFPPTNRGILVRREPRRIAVSLGSQRFLLPVRVTMVQEAFPRKNQLLARPRRMESRGNGWGGTSSVAVRPSGEIALAHAEARAFLATHPLPLYFPRLIVRSLGRVVTCWPSYHDAQFIWPVGYHSQRTFLSFRDPSQMAVYTCIIADGGPEGPQFQVIAEDMPGRSVVARSATDAWLRVLKMLNDQELRMGREPTKFVVNGADAFGFGFPEIATCIEGLDGAELCTKYVFRKLRFAMMEQEVAASARKRALEQAQEPVTSKPKQVRTMNLP
ncbi:hypothetical protein WA588_000077, partial [Blastocystis sp. NMH]